MWSVCRKCEGPIENGECRIYEVGVENEQCGWKNAECGTLRRVYKM